MFAIVCGLQRCLGGERETTGVTVSALVQVVPDPTAPVTDWMGTGAIVAAASCVACGDLPRPIEPGTKPGGRFPSRVVSSGASVGASGKSAVPSGKSVGPSGKSAGRSGKSVGPSGKSAVPSGKSVGPPGRVRRTPRASPLEPGPIASVQEGDQSSGRPDPSAASGDWRDGHGVLRKTCNRGLGPARR